MRVLVLGGQGMLGHKVFQTFSLQFDTFATVHGTERPRLPLYQDESRVLRGVNAREFDTVARAVEQVAPDAVINCIGVVKQLKEASDPIVSISLNSLFPHLLAELCSKRGARMVHVSTDCVFSGRAGNYRESDTPDPVDLYGRTKLVGEVDRPGCLTIRTSIIGRDALRQTGLLEWFLAHRGGRVNGYKNAIFSGLPTQVLARVIGEALVRHRELSGLYHVAAAPISKYDLLYKIREAMKLDIQIDPFDDPPCDRSLDASRWSAATGGRIPGWDAMIAEMAADPTPYDQWRKAFAAI